MNEFVEQCRREWRRLHVPDADADEMAAELAADLEQAEAEGVSAEEVLGAAAADARSFAAAWAGERGVTPWHVRRGKRALPVAALAALAAIAIAGAVLVAVASPSTPRTQVTLGTRSDLAAGRVMQAAPPPAGVWVTQQTGRVLTIEVPSAVVVQRDSGGSDDDMRTIGLVLLIVGLAGIVPLAALALLRS